MLDELDPRERKGEIEASHDCGNVVRVPQPHQASAAIRASRLTALAGDVRIPRRKQDPISVVREVWVGIVPDEIRSPQRVGPGRNRQTPLDSPEI